MPPFAPRCGRGVLDRKHHLMLDMTAAENAHTMTTKPTFRDIDPKRLTAASKPVVTYRTFRMLGPLRSRRERDHVESTARKLSSTRIVSASPIGLV